MRFWRYIYKIFGNLIVNLLVNINAIPTDPIKDLDFNTASPIIYLLPDFSITDLFILRKQCSKNLLPDPLLSVNINGIVLPRYICLHPLNKSVNLFQKYINLYLKYPNIDMQIILVSVMLGPPSDRRIPNKTNLKLNYIKKLLTIVLLGRNVLIHFSPKVSLHYIVEKHGIDGYLATKLNKLARLYFTSQHVASVEENFPARKDILNKILDSKAIIQVIEKEARIKNISKKQAQLKIINIFNGIAANFSYEAIRIADRFLGYLWKLLNHNITVSGIKLVRQLAYRRQGLVYLPCHRSHMDYLLLSYVIYHHGLVPPHIAAGMNLNFWPAGKIFRRLGAFFIHRTFKGQKIYSVVFKEYFTELLSNGYSIEYFIEGGRSRTGKLLIPQTGTLAMTIQTVLRNPNLKITLIPIYIGYDYIMEVSTYAKELNGAHKEKESIMQILRALKKLRKFGQSYVNFGEPLSIISYLNQHIPSWRQTVRSGKNRPSWLMPVVNDIASCIMIRINNAAAITTMNLCCTILLAAHQYSLTRHQLTEQLDCYLQLLRNVPYAQKSKIPSLSSKEIINEFIKMNSLIIKIDVLENHKHDRISIRANQAIIMTYYRNNIYHMIVLPALIAAIVNKYFNLSYLELLSKVNIIFPLLKQELFLHWHIRDLPYLINAITLELARQGLVVIVKNNTLHLCSCPSKIYHLQLLAAAVHETIQKYAVIFYILSINSSLSRQNLERDICKMANILSRCHGINMPDLVNKKFFNHFLVTLHNEGYINNLGQLKVKQIQTIYSFLASLLAKEVKITLETTFNKDY
ncbi:MAG: glycerol-3-phosphate 1-O-acyltransferase PlsB [Candidatus Dasytiphilus stammeri]